MNGFYLDLLLSMISAWTCSVYISDRFGNSDENAEAMLSNNMFSVL